MGVNDDAGRLDARGALAFFASMLAPTGSAIVLAMGVNDDAGCLHARGALAFFASVLAPTGPRW
jgi:hypothetical protein